MKYFSTILKTVFLCAIGACLSFPLLAQSISSLPRRSGASRGMEGQYDFAPVQDRVKTLELIAKSSKANYSKIKTIQGKYTFENSILPNKEYEKVIYDSAKIKILPNSHLTTTGEFDFSFNASPQKFFVDYKPLSVSGVNFDTTNSKEAKNERDITSIIAPHVLSIVTDESYMSIQPEKFYGVFTDFPNIEQESGKVVFVDEASKSLAHQEGAVPNPSTFFKIGARFLWEEMDKLVEAIKVENQIKKESEQFSIDVYEDTQNQSIFKVTLTTGQNDETILRTIFVDGKKGFNAIKYYDRIIPKDTTKRPRFHVVTSLEYTSSDDGIFFPSSIDIHHPNESGMDKFVRHISLVTIELNASLSKNTFSYKNLGLNNGDRVRDDIKRELFFYKDGDLVKSLPKLPMANSSRYFLVRVILVVTGIILIVIGVMKKYIASKNKNNDKKVQR